MAQRARNVNKEQKEILIEYVQKNPKLISRKFTKEFAYKAAQHLWQIIATQLNSVPNGGQKDWQQWRKVWQGMRTKTKAKKARNVKERNATGGGVPEAEPLSTQENAVLGLMSLTLWSGIGKVAESTIEGFDMTESEPEVVLQERESNTLIESPMVTEANTPRGTKKDQRLSETIKAARSMEKIAEKKLELKQKYYEAKLELMQRDVQAKEEIAKHMKFICSKFE